jgi:hypothetical protein
LKHKHERDQADRHQEPTAGTISVPVGEPSPAIARISHEVKDELAPAEIQAEG